MKTVFQRAIPCRVISPAIQVHLAMICDANLWFFFSPFHNPIHENDLILVSHENKILTRENKNITPLKINNKNINGSPLCSCLSIYHGLCFIQKVKKRKNHTNRIWQPKSNMANVCLKFYLLKDTFQLH
jgi:hypothetical protein